MSAIEDFAAAFPDRLWDRLRDNHFDRTTVPGPKIKAPCVIIAEIVGWPAFLMAALSLS
jgi:hypothetical protein